MIDFDILMMFLTMGSLSLAVVTHLRDRISHLEAAQALSTETCEDLASIVLDEIDRAERLARAWHDATGLHPAAHIGKYRVAERARMEPITKESEPYR